MAAPAPTDIPSNARRPRVAMHGAVRRLTYGTLASGLSQVVNICSQLALVPLFLSSWGSGRYGEWLALSAAVSYLGMLDGGVQTFVINQLTKLRAGNDDGAYAKLLNSALALVGVVSTAAALMVLTVAALVPIEQWMRVSEPGVRLAVALLALQVIVALPQGLLSGIYRTAGEYAREQMIGNARKLLTLAATAAALVAGAGFVTLAALQLAALALTCIFVLWDVRRRHTWIVFDWRDADRHAALALLGPSSFFFLMQVWAGIALQGSTLLVSSLEGAAAVAVFVSLRTLVSFVRQVTGALQNALSPELTTLEARGRLETLRSVHLGTAKLLMISCAYASVFLYLSGADIVRVWTAGQLQYDAGVMHALLVLLGVHSFWTTSAVVMSATNNHRKIAVCITIAGFVGLAFGYVLGRLIGTPGVIYGMAAADLFICGYYVPRAACRQMNESFTVFLFEVLGRGALVLAMLVAGTLLLHPVLQHLTWFPRMLAWAACLGAITAVTGYFFLLNTQERRWMQSRIGVLRMALAARVST